MHDDRASRLKGASVKSGNGRFQFFKQFNGESFEQKSNCRDRLIPEHQQWFSGENLASVFARALCQHRAMPFKEVLESFEFFARVRKRIRSANVADLCCGHGLVGVLFAMFEKRVEQVVLLDKVQPDSFARVSTAAIDVAPWVEPKLKYEQAKLRDALNVLETGTSIVGVHACGTRTDLCIDHAIALNGAVAVLPCCHRHKHQSPECLKQMLGPDVAIDVDRTYRLHASGYQTRWDHIPESITSKNRLLIGVPGTHRFRKQ